MLYLLPGKPHLCLFLPDLTGQPALSVYLPRGEDLLYQAVNLLYQNVYPKKDPPEFFQ